MFLAVVKYFSFGEEESDIVEASSEEELERDIESWVRHWLETDFPVEIHYLAATKIRKIEIARTDTMYSTIQEMEAKQSSIEI